jgi:hypothetical protein
LVWRKFKRRMRSGAMTVVVVVVDGMCCGACLPSVALTTEARGTKCDNACELAEGGGWGGGGVCASLAALRASAAALFAAARARCASVISTVPAAVDIW